MGRIWSEEAKFQSWLDVEIAACQANAQLGRVPPEAMAVIKDQSALRWREFWRSRRRCATM
jgi:adenylosuccinate lyase